jgi:hypothetical protein
MTIPRLFRFAAMLLVPALLGNSLAFAAKKPVDPAVMKAKIQVRGVGQGVRITLVNQTEVKGLIVAIREHGFTLKPKKEPETREIDYAQVIGVHSDKLTRGQKVAITVGVVAGAIVITAVVLTIKIDNAFSKPWVILSVPAKK